MKNLAILVLMLVLAKAGQAQTIQHTWATNNPTNPPLTSSGHTYVSTAFYDQIQTYTFGDQYGIDYIVGQVLAACRIADGAPGIYDPSTIQVVGAVGGMNGRMTVDKYRMCAGAFPTFTEGSPPNPTITAPGLLSSNLIGCEFGTSYAPGTNDTDTNGSPIAGQNHWLQIVGSRFADLIPNMVYSEQAFAYITTGQWSGWYFWVDGYLPENPSYDSKMTIMYDMGIPSWANSWSLADCPRLPTSEFTNSGIQSDHCIQLVFMTAIAWYEDAAGYITQGPTDRLRIAQYGGSWGYVAVKDGCP